MRMGLWSEDTAQMVKPQWFSALHICKSKGEEKNKRFVAKVEKQNVRQKSSFWAKEKSLVNWRIWCTFAVEFALKRRPPQKPLQSDALLYITQVSEVNEVNEVKEVKGRCHWDVVYFSALNRTAKLLSFNFPWCEHSELTPLTSLTSIKSITSET